MPLEPILLGLPFIVVTPREADERGDLAYLHDPYIAPIEFVRIGRVSLGVRISDLTGPLSRDRPVIENADDPVSELIMGSRATLIIAVSILYAFMQ